jgi:CRP/FNR family transcriptional regulator, cyclic AMP receptor protein
MVTGTASLAANTSQEDALAHLPCSAVVEYRKGSTIYSRSQPSKGLYLVIEGRVKVSRYDETGHEVVVDLYQADEFFGESGFINLGCDSDEATAFEDAKVMAWTAADLEMLAIRQPRLGIALLQVLVRRNVDLTNRVVSLAVDDIARRMARTLIRFSDRMGTLAADGTVQMIPITHEVLSQYVGTSREVVTLHMNRFRRHDCMRYSRKGLVLNRAALCEWLGTGNSETSRNSSRKAGQPR